MALLCLPFSHLSEDGLVQPERGQLWNQELPASIIGGDGLLNVEFELKPFTLQHPPCRTCMRRQGLLGYALCGHVPELLKTHVNQLLNGDLLRVLNLVVDGNARVEDAPQHQQQNARNKQPKSYTVSRCWAKGDQHKHAEQHQRYEQ